MLGVQGREAWKNEIVYQKKAGNEKFFNTQS